MIHMRYMQSLQPICGLLLQSTLCAEEVPKHDLDVEAVSHRTLVSSRQVLHRRFNYIVTTICSRVCCYYPALVLFRLATASR